MGTVLSMGHEEGPDVVGYRRIPCLRGVHVIKGADSKKSSNGCSHWLFLESRPTPPPHIRRDAPVFWRYAKTPLPLYRFQKELREALAFHSREGRGVHPRHSPA